MPYNKNNDSNPGSGVLFPKKGRSSESQPIMDGNIEIDEECLEHLNDCFSKNEPMKLSIAAWNRVAKGTGNKFYSLKVQPPFQKDKAVVPARRPATRPTAPTRKPVLQDLDDEIPF